MLLATGFHVQHEADDSNVRLATGSVHFPPFGRSSGTYHTLTVQSFDDVANMLSLKGFHLMSVILSVWPEILYWSGGILAPSISLRNTYTGPPPPDCN